MNSSAVADTSTSLWSTSTRVMRPADRVRVKRDFYMWFFGQIHAKRFLIFTMFALSCFAIYMLTFTTSYEFKFTDIPGFDKKQYTRNKELVDPPKTDIEHFEDAIGVKRPETHKVITVRGIIYKNVLNTWCYMTLISIAVAAIGIRLSENRRSSWSIFKRVNPALFLIPLLLIALTFSFPLMIWSIRTANISHLCDGRMHDGHLTIPCRQAFFWLDYIRFNVLPILFAWIGFLYLHFGCFLAFIYVWRRASASLKARDLAAASFRSFRDKNHMLRRADNNNGSKSCRSRFSTGRTGSFKNLSGRTGSRPALSSIFRDLNTSTASAPAVFSTADCIDLEAGSDMGTMSRRPLATVVEESDSAHEGSQNSLLR